MSIFSRIRLRSVLYALIGCAILWGASVVIIWSWRAHGQPYTSGIVSEITPLHIVITRPDGTKEGILYDTTTQFLRGQSSVMVETFLGEHIVAAGRYEADGHFHARVMRILTPRPH